MNWFDIINKVIVVVGIPSIIGILIFVGKKLQLLEHIDLLVNKEIRPDLKEIREKFFALEGRYSGTYENNSPIKLTDKGNILLKDSGIKVYIDKNKILLIDKICPENKLTPYDIQTKVFDYFNEMEFPSDVEKEIKNYAYAEGISTDVVRRVGAIYFRDICLEKYKMRIDDLDKHLN